MDQGSTIAGYSDGAAEHPPASVHSRRSPFRLAPWCFVGLLLLLAGFKFVDQDFRQRYSQPVDFRNIYFSTVVWFHGQQPYDPQIVLQQMKATDQASYSAGRINPSVDRAGYPPSCFTAALPFSFFHWKTAHLVELLLSVCAYLALLWRVRRRLPGLRYWYFVAFALAFAPFHGGLQLSNVSALVTPLICLAVFCVDEMPVAAALLFGFSAALKPQLVLLFLLHLCLTRRWRVFLVASGIAVSCLGFGILWMELHGLAWIQPYRDLVSSQFAPGVDNENGILSRGQINFSLFNLQPLAYWLTRSFRAAVLAGYVAFLLLCVPYARYVWTHRERTIAGAGTALWGYVAVLGFFPIYQRYYNAVLLLIAMVWALETWQEKRSKLVAGMGLVFLVPASKLPVLGRLLGSLLAGGHGAGSSARAALLKPGIGDLRLNGLEMALYALPFFVVIAFAAVLGSFLWTRRRHEAGPAVLHVRPIAAVAAPSVWGSSANL